MERQCCIRVESRLHPPKRKSTIRRLSTPEWVVLLFLPVAVSLASGQPAFCGSIQWPPCLTLRGETSMTVNFKTEVPIRGALSFYRSKTDSPIRIEEEKPGLFHHLVLPGLVPGESYAYLIEKTGEDRSAADPTPFRMPSQEGPLTFFVLGDTQAPMVLGERKTDVRDVKRIVDAMAADDRKPDFFVHCGDHVETDAIPEWTGYFEAVSPVASRVPVFPIMGNHEEMSDSENYFNAFSFPGGGGRNGWEWYAHPMNNVLLVFLNTNFQDLEHIRKQLEWLEATLKTHAGKTWKLIFTHHPLYSSSVRHAPDSPLAPLLEPVLLRYGVDAVFSGHHHAYQRILKKGIQHIVSAGGNSDFGRLKEKKVEGTVTFLERTLHYLKVTVEKDRLWAEMRVVGRKDGENPVKACNEVFDRFEVRK